MIEQDPNGKSPHHPGAKLDADKPMAGEVLGGFAEAIQAVIEVGTHGAKKYTIDGWKAVDDAKRRYTSAMLRHWLAEHSERMDDKSGLTHAAHVAWNALARLHFILQEEAQQPEYRAGPVTKAWYHPEVATQEPKDQTSPAAASPAPGADSDPSNAGKSSAGDPRRDTGEAPSIHAFVSQEVSKAHYGTNKDCCLAIESVCAFITEREKRIVDNDATIIRMMRERCDALRDALEKTKAGATPVAKAKEAPKPKRDPRVDPIPRDSIRCDGDVYTVTQVHDGKVFFDSGKGPCKIPLKDWRFYSADLMVLHTADAEESDGS